MASTFLAAASTFLAAATTFLPAFAGGAWALCGLGAEASLPLALYLAQLLLLTAVPELIRRRKFSDVTSIREDAFSSLALPLTGFGAWYSGIGGRRSANRAAVAFSATALADVAVEDFTEEVFAVVAAGNVLVAADDVITERRFGGESPMSKMDFGAA